jgi:hypothetical protein
MPPKGTPIPPDILDLYKKLVATRPGVEVKGAAMPYTSINGNMFSFLSGEGQLNLRLSKSDLAAFLERYDARQSVQHGVVMKEYAAVPDHLLRNINKLTPYFQQSCAYAKSLKPKATKRGN